MRYSALPLALTALVAFTVASPAVAEPADVAGAIAQTDRPADYLAMDAGRKPLEILNFLQLEKGDRVIDLATGTGYYAELIARAVGPQGSVEGVQPKEYLPDEITVPWKSLQARVPNAKLVVVDSWDLNQPSNSYDVALVSLFYHDWYVYNEERRIANHLFRIVKPGGVLAIIDHAAAAGSDPKESTNAFHRIDPAVVRADFERAGFVLEAESDVLANPADPHNVPVFDASISGKTDRFVQRYRKPG